MDLQTVRCSEQFADTLLGIVLGMLMQNHIGEGSVI